jgi:hypothetical protein
MNIEELVASARPNRRTTANSRRAGPPKSASGTIARKRATEVPMVRVRVSLMLRSISSASGILLCEVLAHAVVDDDLVVDREAHDGEDCRGRREVEFEPHQSEEADCLNVAGLSAGP